MELRTTDAVNCPSGIYYAPLKGKEFCI